MYVNFRFVLRVSVIAVLLQDTEELTLVNDPIDVPSTTVQKALFVKPS